MKLRRGEGGNHIGLAALKWCRMGRPTPLIGPANKTLARQRRLFFWIGQKSLTRAHTSGGRGSV